MLNQKIPANEELQGADAALRRAALKAKEEAERLGTPYVVRPIDEAKIKTNNAKTKQRQTPRLFCGGQKS